MALTLSLPPLDPNPAHPPETRSAQVFPWLDTALRRDAIEAARLIGDALGCAYDPATEGKSWRSWLREIEKQMRPTQAKR